MLKQLVLMIALTILILFFQPAFHSGLGYFVSLHHFVLTHLDQIFKNSQIGHYVQQVIALMIIPLALGLILAGSEWVIRRRTNPHVMLAIWWIWLILVTALLAIPVT